MPAAAEAVVADAVFPVAGSRCIPHARADEREAAGKVRMGAWRLVVPEAGMAVVVADLLLVPVPVPVLAGMWAVDGMRVAVVVDPGSDSEYPGPGSVAFAAWG